MFYILGSPVDGPCRCVMRIPAYTDRPQRRNLPQDSSSVCKAKEDTCELVNGIANQ
jgi:hypothetical protein